MSRSDSAVKHQRFGIAGELSVITSLEKQLQDAVRCDLHVFISGGSPRLRRLLARLLHRRGRDAHAPFIAIGDTMAQRLARTSPPALVGGSFCLAHLPDPCTVYLPEICDIDPAGHRLLSEALEQRAGNRQKLGLDRPRMRFISATSRRPHPSLQSILSPELFYRLNMIHLDLPAAVAVANRSAEDR